ncbi:hypothetical protein PSACC_01854 [Paramicrosporidium saccamoebae]|uniref:Uncharacterized protein n=1 Tax=Paramicrosporidium saccamoebae TaxID=1246581 RepID=A0A2H9TKQ2_9FUNG|nr:hypothetical protein PSACC_01854 [Paramicrosporidium saccamoebae]
MVTQSGIVVKDLTDFRDSPDGIGRFLALFEIVLPYKLPEGPLPVLTLEAAHDYKWSMLKMAWDNSIAQNALCNNRDHADRFAKAIMSNLLANDSELGKPAVILKDNEEPFEPAFDSFLGKGYIAIATIFDKVQPGCYLESALYSYQSLMNFAKLFHSPDPREREWLQMLLEGRIAAFFGRINEPVIMGALKTILGMAQAAFLDVKSSATHVTLRPIASMIYITDT